MPMIDDLAEFTRHYIMAALWSSTDNSDPSGGIPLDDAKWGIERMPKATRDAMQADCRQWLLKNAGLVASLEAVASEYGYGAHPDCGRVAPVAAACAHDLWLTRNGHGTGFWDRGLPDALGDALTAAAKKAGTRDLYTARGWIYQA